MRFFGTGLRLSLPFERLLADEAALLVPGDGKSETRLERRVFIGDVVPPMAVGFLHAAIVERVHPGGRQAEFLSRLPEGFEHMGREFGRHVKFPAKFTDIGNAAGAHPRIADLDLLRMAEGKGGIGQVRARELLQQRARMGTHYRDHRQA